MIVVTGVASSWRNSLRMVFGMSPGTESVFLAAFIFSYTSYSLMAGCSHMSFSSLDWTSRGKLSSFIGVNYWQIIEKKLAISSADSLAVRFLSSWDGRALLPQEQQSGKQKSNQNKEEQYIQVSPPATPNLFVHCRAPAQLPEDLMLQDRL